MVSRQGRTRLKIVHSFTRAGPAKYRNQEVRRSHYCLCTGSLSSLPVQYQYTASSILFRLHIHFNACSIIRKNSEEDSRTVPILLSKFMSNIYQGHPHTKPDCWDSNFPIRKCPLCFYHRGSSQKVRNLSSTKLAN
jgi:hypothetical protein